jgi:DNA-binding transcriptional ArsR family regulator
MKATDRFRKSLGTVKARAAVYKALGHPTRLFIVEELSHGERCVCELTAMVGADVSTVSKHLSVLKSVGLVEDEKRGAQVFYRLLVPCVLTSFSCIDAVLGNRLTKTLGGPGASQ